MFEEILFRGVLLPLLARSLGAWPGILLTALPFALLHGPQNTWAWQQVVLIGVAGAIFGWVRYRTGATSASFLLHAAYNATGFLGFAIARWQTLS
jgi:membrane protease YdiL (CAAX protease family)